MPGGKPESSAFPERFSDREVCRLVTTGRSSGQDHDIEIWFGVAAGRIYFISGNGPGADWYRNALVTAEARVVFDGASWRGRARDVVDREERRLVGRVMTAKYGGWGGDPEIGLTEHDWTWRVPALAVEDFSTEGRVATGPVPPAAPAP